MSDKATSSPGEEPKEESVPEVKSKEVEEEARTEETAAVVNKEAEVSNEKKDTPAPVDDEIEDGSKLVITFRDVIVGEGSAGHRTNLLLQDMMRLYRIIWKLQGKEAPSTSTDEGAKEIAEHLFRLVKYGKEYELAGLKDVPKPFMKSKGRFLKKEDKNWTEFTDEQAKEALASAMVEEFKNDDLGDLTQSPFSDFKEMLERQPTGDDVPLLPQPKDAVLFLCEDSASGEKMYEQQGGNRTVFNLASQLVSPSTKTPEKRVEAALKLLKGLDEAELHEEDKEKVSPAVASQNSRFLVRLMESEAKINWKLLSGAEAAQFALIFIFEVFLEKEIHLIAQNTMGVGLADISSSIAHLGEPVKAGTDPIDGDVTDADVLFGRGGMTNSHPGNRRFREIIALHRPDYVRVVKMEKPSVARRIVRAIRQGTPPGRFLKKHDDGKWYDVGDRTAAEKTSQGLRERSNAEKRDRQALRDSLRGRKDGEDDDDDEDDEASGSKKQKTSESAGGVGTVKNRAGGGATVTASMKQTAKKKSEGSELITAGLPPNAVDENGDVIPSEFDILLGRGGLTNHHKGNKRFRDIVALHRPDYVRAPKIQKPSVARVIVRAIRNGDPPGRFLRKDEKTGKWVDVGDKKAAEKTSQALREKANEEKEQAKPDAASLGVTILLPDPPSYLPTGIIEHSLLLTGTAAVKGESTDESKNDEKESTKDSGEEKITSAQDKEEKIQETTETATV